MDKRDREIEKQLERWKKKTLNYCLEATATKLQLLVRLRDADEDGNCVCCSCGKKDHWKFMQGGHLISRRYKATMLSEDNIHSQCPRCNGYLGGNFAGYSLFMKKRYGANAIYNLSTRAKKSKKWTKDELAPMIVDYRAEIKQIKESMGY